MLTNLIPRAFPVYKMDTSGKGYQNTPKHNEMSLFRLNNDFRLPENKQGCQSLEMAFENTISLCVTLQHFYSLVQGTFLLASRHLESGEGPGNEVGL